MSLRRCLVVLVLSAAAHAVAQPVLMMSDIHFDPFHDPARFPALLAAPVSGWKAILDAPPSATQAADFDKLQSACGVRGVDTPAALLESALAAAHARQATPLFVVVPGDLMAHKFDCRFQQLAALVPARKLTGADGSAFAAKTVAFVALQLHLTFPETPVYFALGNNDSGCRDYQEDPGSAFLQADGAAFAADTLTSANRTAVAKEFSRYGDYNVLLPMPHMRLLVLQDIFESAKFTTCDGKPGGAAAAAQIAWLRAQLSAARAAQEHVWVMAHIPPGIDAYSTFTKGRDVCGGGQPEPFLSGEALATTLGDFADVVRLALFGHTHMDELRVYRGADGALVPGKLVPSISPINGNAPAFTMAQVDTQTGTLADYTVYAGPGWTPEYTFSATYHLPDVSGASVARLLDGFARDKAGSSEPAVDYQKFFFAGDPMGGLGKAALRAAAMKLVWPIYSCTMTEPLAAGFKRCLCPAAKE